MATKRMFSKEIVGSDAFQDMPVSSQLLYFHLGMEADDDGFIGNPKKIARSLGVAEDDMKILIAKNFVIVFDSGVLVIKHHRINNNWDKHNCKRTLYLEEFNQIYIKENKAYTSDKTQGVKIQSEISLKPVFRIEENRREENKEMSEKSDAPSQFDTFWNSYPKKELKKKSLEIWKRKKLDKHLPEILAFIEKAKRTDRWKKGFVKQPTTFLNNESWNDDLTSYGDQNTQSTAPPSMTYKTVDEIMAEKGLVDKKIGTNHFDRSQLTKTFKHSQ